MHEENDFKEIIVDVMNVIAEITKDVMEHIETIIEVVSGKMNALTPIVNDYCLTTKINNSLHSWNEYINNKEVSNNGEEDQ